MAQVAAQMYEADMLGYTGELNYAGQMDANASDRYGYDVGYEGTKYTADKNYEAAEYTANKNYEGTEYAANKNYEGTTYNADANERASKYAADANERASNYAADKNLEGQKAQAAATRAAAASNASRYASQLGAQGVDYQAMVDKHTKEDGSVNWAALKGDLVGNGVNAADAEAIIEGTKASTDSINKGIKVLNQGNASTWIKALDGNNEALKALGVNIFGQKKSNVNNTAATNAVNEAMRQIASGEYTFVSDQQLMNDLKNHRFGFLSWGF